MDGATGAPLKDAAVNLFADDLRIASGPSDSNGAFHYILPSHFSSSRLTVEAQHQSYLTSSKVSVAHSSMTQAIRLQPAPLPPPRSVLALKFTSTFHFSGLPITLSRSHDSTHYSYGFSSVESDQQVRGNGVRIRTVQIDLKIREHSGYAGCDAWVLLGPGPSLFQPGTVSEPAMYPTDVVPSPSVAPVQAQFVIGNGKQIANSVISFRATYNFEKKEWGGDIDNTHKEFFAPLLSLPTGLYAQIFLWNGNPDVNADVVSVSLIVEGTKPNQQ